MPNAIALMREKKINMIVNTPAMSSGARRDGYMLRRLAVELEIPFLTTANAAKVTVGAIKRVGCTELKVRSMKEFHE
jgi:carbamoyl-phosphate synthase large subunit